MNSSGSLNLRGTVQSRSDAGSLLVAPGDAVLVSRGGQDRLLVLVCPCGCGERFPVNLDPRAGPAWRRYTSRDGACSLFPSVWRKGGCNAHYIVWRDRILLFGHGSEHRSSPVPGVNWSSLEAKVLSQLPPDRHESFVVVAELLGEVPWDVAEACRRLTWRSLAEEGTGDLRQHFRRLPRPPR